MNDSTLFGSIWRNAYYGNPVFFFESKDISDKAPKYFELMKFPITDSLEIDSSITFTWDVNRNQFSNAIVFAYGENPLTDVYGEPIIIHCGGGALCFTYPPETYTVTPISEINEIRIKEIRIFNDVSQTYKFVPIAIQLTPQLVSRMQDDVWLDLNKMQGKTPNIVNEAWYTFIFERRYEGSQYMQLKTAQYE